MRKFRRVALIGALFLAAGVARADDQAGDANPSRVDEASHAVASMNETLSYVKAKIRRAQDSRDPIKLNCVNEKSAQIGALISIAQNSLDDMRNFISAGEVDAADHELEKIMITKRKVDGYKADADACVGQLEVGDGKVVVIYNDSAVQGTVDPTAEADPPPTTFQPPAASPTQ